MSPENSGPILSPDVIDEERLLARIPRQIIFAAAVLTVPVGLIFGVRAAFVFLLGGMLSALGFAWLRQSLARLLSRGRKDALRSGILMYLLRLMLICGVFLIIILLFPRQILAFGAGFSMIVPVVLVEGGRALLRMKTWKT